METLKMNSTIVLVHATNSTDNSSYVTHSNCVTDAVINSSKTIDVATIVKSVFLCIMMIGSIFGNGLVLTAIRTTPSLWTKNNKILASLTVADFWAGLSMLYYVPSIILTSVVNNPCSYNVMQVVLAAFTLLPPYASCFNLILVAIDRYVAIVYPLEYEMRMTDRVVVVMITASWLMSAVCAGSFLLWLINADLSQCALVPKKYYFMNPTIYMLVGVVFVFVYMKILIVAWHQHIAIEQTTAEGVTSGGVQSRSEVDTEAASNVTEQEQHKNYRRKVRKAEFKALRLTSAIIGTFLVLWLPHEIGRGLLFVGDTRPFVAYLVDIGASTGMLNSSFNWILYGAVSKTYQKAFSRLLKRCFHAIEMKF